MRVLQAQATIPEEQIKRLVEARRRVGRLRRSLSPHREVFAALSHSEFDPISSEGSAEKFTELVRASRRCSELSARRERWYRQLLRRLDRPHRAPHKRDHQDPDAGVDSASSRCTDRRCCRNERELRRARVRFLATLLDRHHIHRRHRPRNARPCAPTTLDLTIRTTNPCWLARLGARVEIPAAAEAADSRLVGGRDGAGYCTRHRTSLASGRNRRRRSLPSQLPTGTTFRQDRTFSRSLDVIGERETDRC